MACEEDEELVWSKVDGEYVTHILIVSLSFSFFYNNNMLS